MLGVTITMWEYQPKEALCARDAQLADVMSTMVKTINLIQSRVLNHHVLRAFPSEIDAQFGDLIYHSDVRWLSHGTVLERSYSLRYEIDHFLKEGHSYVELSKPECLADLIF